MSKTETLFQNKWVTVKEKTMDNGANWVYTSADWCGSQGVAILPLRASENKEIGHQILARFDIIPAHSEDVEMCSITGGMDKALESPLHTAVRELEEEAGYRVDPKHLIYLGTLRPNKSSDMTTYLFAVDLDKSNAVEVEAVGDGTLGEQDGYCDWVTLGEAISSKDPLLHALILRLMDSVYGYE